MLPIRLTRAFLLSVLMASSGMAMAEEAVYRLHFRPVDHALGDVHPFFRDGECFLYYLKPGGYDSALVRSKDWLHWTETPISHEAVGEGDRMARHYALGVFQDPLETGTTPVYRSFFGHAQGGMASSVSSDLLHWSCAPKEVFIPPADYYQRRRDPFVFWMPETRQFGCVMTTWMKGRPKETAGAVSFATSPDLKHWQDHGPILDPGTIGEPECPQMFELGGRWYLLASLYDRAVGQPVYWSAGGPRGPWGELERGPVGKLDGKDLCAAQVAFEGGKPMLFGWVPLNPARPGKQTWGGHLALPREVYALPDGRLGTRLPEKVTQSLTALPWRAMPDFSVTAEPQAMDGSWPQLAAEFTLILPEAAHEVRLRFAPLGEVVLDRQRLRILDASGECWSELEVELPSDKPMPMRLFIDRDIVEVFVNETYSLVARLPTKPGALTLSCQTDGGVARITSLRASELLLPR